MDANRQDRPHRRYRRSIVAGVVVVLLGGTVMTLWFLLKPVRVPAPTGPALPIPTASDPIPFPHRALSEILAAAVDDQGRVDYIEVAARRADLERYLFALAQTSPHHAPKSFPSEADRLAYWINAYNAAVLYGVIQRPGLKSVYDRRYRFFGLTRYVFGGEALSFTHARELGRPTRVSRASDSLRAQLRVRRVSSAAGGGVHPRPPAGPTRPGDSSFLRGPGQGSSRGRRRGPLPDLRVVRGRLHRGRRAGGLLSAVGSRRSTGRCAGSIHPLRLVAQRATRSSSTGALSDGAASTSTSASRTGAIRRSDHSPTATTASPLATADHTPAM